MANDATPGAGEGGRDDSIISNGVISGVEPTAEDEGTTNESVIAGVEPHADIDETTEEQSGLVETASERPTPKQPEPPPAHPATTNQKVTLAILLLAWTIVSLIMAWASLNTVQEVMYEPADVDWKRVTDVQLETGPVGFRYIGPVNGEGTSGKLKYIGPMSDETRKKLVALFPSAENVAFDSEEVAEQFAVDAATYVAAIDLLSEKCLLLANKSVVALLLLGGCCGMVGVQLRSMWDFVRNICFKNPPQLDVVTWWPWYLIRPIIGFVLGILAISMIMSGFLEVDNHSTRSSMWWLSITVLVGFGATEFMARLRLVVAALFAEKG